MPSGGPEHPTTFLVIPAKLVLECFHREAGIQGQSGTRFAALDPRFHGGDDRGKLI